MDLTSGLHLASGATLGIQTDSTEERGSGVLCKYAKRYFWLIINVIMSSDKRALHCKQTNFLKKSYARKRASDVPADKHEPDNIE